METQKQKSTDGVDTSFRQTSDSLTDIISIQLGTLGAVRHELLRGVVNNYLPKVNDDDFLRQIEYLTHLGLVEKTIYLENGSIPIITYSPTEKLVGYAHEVHEELDNLRNKSPKESVN